MDTSQEPAAETVDSAHSPAELRRAEAAIINRVLDGETQEFRLLVLRYQDQVFAMIMRQVANDAVAKDLAQETFIKAFKALGQFSHRAKFSTWLIRIALNVTSSYFSSRKYKEQLRSVEYDSQKHERDTMAEKDKTENDFSEDDISKLRLAISKLKPKFREVLVLCALEKKKYEEAAAILGIPLGTVRSRLNKARNLLREEYFRGQL